MSTTAFLVLAYLVTFCSSAPTESVTISNSTSVREIDSGNADDSFSHMPNTPDSLRPPMFMKSVVPPRLNVTVNLNCSCVISTPSLSGDSKLVLPGIIVNGSTEYRCDSETRNKCKQICAEKAESPIFNLESQSVGLNMENGVNMNDYLCGLLTKGDSLTFVAISMQMECTEEAADFQLFNAQSNSFIISPTSSLNCKNTVIETTTVESLPSPSS